MMQAQQVDSITEPRVDHAFLAAHVFPRRPEMTSERLGWADLVVQRYTLPSFRNDLPPAKDLSIGITTSGTYNLSGRIGDEKQTSFWGEPGKITVTPEGSGMSVKRCGEGNLYLLHIDPRLFMEIVSEVFEADPTDLSIRPLFGWRDERAYALARQVGMEADAPSAGSRLFAEALTRALCLHLIRNYSSACRPKAQDRLPAPSGRASRIAAYIHANFAKDISLDDLARISGVSSSQVNRTFRSETGSSPYHYLIKVRIDAARELLERTSLPIIEVGFRCGFERPSHFATAFRRTLGMTPRDYRAARRT